MLSDYYLNSVTAAVNIFSIISAWKRIHSIRLTAGLGRKEFSRLSIASHYSRQSGVFIISGSPSAGEIEPYPFSRFAAYSNHSGKSRLHIRPK